MVFPEQYIQQKRTKILVKIFWIYFFPVPGKNLSVPGHAHPGLHHYIAHASEQWENRYDIFSCLTVIRKLK